MAFVARLYGAKRARRRYESKEIGWKKYEHFQKHNGRYIGTGVIFALIGWYGFITEPRFILGEENPILIAFLFFFCLIVGFASLGAGLAQYVHSKKKPSAEREE